MKERVLRSVKEGMRRKEERTVKEGRKDREGSKGRKECCAREISKKSEYSCQ